MAFGDLGIAKQIAANAPKYRRIVEPFGDKGTFALFPGKKKPKEYRLNIVDETIFAVMSYIQSGASVKALKGYDWVGSREAFESAAAIAATEGPDLFYRFFYLKKFSAKASSPDDPPIFDDLKAGHDMSSMLYALPQMKVGIKGVALTNEDPLGLIGGGGNDTFFILLPGPDHVDAVEAQLPGLSSPFFYAKKSSGNGDLFDAVARYSSQMTVSHLAVSSIMMATYEVRTNYESRLTPLELPEGGQNAQ